MDDGSGCGVQRRPRDPTHPRHVRAQGAWRGRNVLGSTRAARCFCVRCHLARTEKLRFQIQLTFTRQPTGTTTSQRGSARRPQTSVSQVRRPPLPVRSPGRTRRRRRRTRGPPLAPTPAPGVAAAAAAVDRATAAAPKRARQHE